MLEKVLSVEMPVGENNVIWKNRHVPRNAGPDLSGLKRLCVVSGIHGDELEGQYVCYELNRILTEHSQHLKGIVDIYPALNPLGIDSIQRGVPRFDLDMNRIFPGNLQGTVTEWAAHQIVEDLKGADFAIDIHASNIFLREIPQVRVNINTADVLVKYAKQLNVDFVWIHQASTVLESTLAYSMNALGVKTLVVEMGVGMRLTVDFCKRLVHGILNLMKNEGMWDGEVPPVKEPIVSADRAVSFINAEKPGLFVPAKLHSSMVEAGDLVGQIVDPFKGEVREECRTPIKGLLFTLREYPIVNVGSLIARILEDA
ncbi:MAG: M14 family metallopeptidase [Burkholderiales bacterium]|nr:M14 family metallopeptidase [Burkholderiales bacterium]